MDPSKEKSSTLAEFLKSAYPKETIEYMKTFLESAQSSNSKPSATNSPSTISSPKMEGKLEVGRKKIAKGINWVDDLDDIEDASDGIKMKIKSPKMDGQAKARRKRMAKEIKWDDDLYDIEDSSRRSDGTRMQIMSHLDVVEANYNHQVSHYLKHFIKDKEPGNMEELASSVHRMTRLRKKVGNAYETSTPKNSDTPMFFDFGGRQWKTEVSEIPKLNVAEEQLKYNQRMEELFKNQIMASVMEKVAQHGSMEAFAATLTEEEKFTYIKFLAM